MTRNALQSSAIALGVAAFVSSFALYPARADTSGAQPSLAEPAPTPGWAEGPADMASGAAAGNAVVHRPATHAHFRHAAQESPHRAVRRSDPVAEAARGIAGGVADLGAVAAYPIYCFPHYGSCAVRTPHQF
jgi:hypothetical protein